MFLIRTLIAVILVAAFLGGQAVAGRAAADSVCYRDWSDAGPVVRSKDLLPVSRVLRLVKRDVTGKVVKVTLCKGATTYFYKVAVSAAGGSVSWLRVDARSGRMEPLVRR